MIRYLVEDAPSVGRRLSQVRDNQDLVPIHNSAFQGHAEAIVVMTRDNFTDPDPVSGVLGVTPLNFAAGRLHVEAARALLDAGADVNHDSPRWRTPLLASIAGASHPEEEATANLLLDWGADATVTNRFERGPIFYALTEETARRLLEAGDNPAAVDTSGRTVLHSAVGRRAPGLARFGVQFGVDRWIKDLMGRTALEWAQLELEKGTDGTEALKEIVDVLSG